MSFLRKMFSKFRASLYVFKKAEIMRNIVNKEIHGEYDNLCAQCYFNERYQERARLYGILEPQKILKISIYLGGALGDYIVYLRFVDEISTICDCSVDLFLDRIEFAQFVYGKRKNVTIIHDAANCLFLSSCTQYDLAVHLDHGLTLKNCKLGDIQVKAPEFYTTACRIVEYSRSHELHLSDQSERECVLLRRAKFLGETKWSKLSCGGAVNMGGMYSNILLDPAYFPVLERYQLKGCRYITVNYGADKNMGGTAQTKVLPAATLERFIARFKEVHPDYLVVQTGVANSAKLSGADCYAFDCRLEETAILLKYSICHIDSEGGLVHLASQMSTRCVVSFGPTPFYYYGYPRNENIVSPACNDCMAVNGRWSTVCPRKLQKPVCMQAITAEMILERAEKVLAQVEKREQTQPERTGSFPETSDEIKGMARPGRVCFIGKLNCGVIKAAEEAHQRGWRVWVYIPLETEESTVKSRTDLKKQGIQVEYGNLLNIAQADHVFDLVYCELKSIPEDWIGMARRECARIATSSGEIIWYVN